MNPANHIAIIMDGNGRWALKRKKPRNYGHQQGLKTIEKIVNYSIKKKISYLTLFTFSSENWKRPINEINFLFKLLENYFKKNLHRVISNGIKVKIIGKKSKLAKNTAPCFFSNFQKRIRKSLPNRIIKVLLLKCYKKLRKIKEG